MLGKNCDDDDIQIVMSWLYKKLYGIETEIPVMQISL